MAAGIGWAFARQNVSVSKFVHNERVPFTRSVTKMTEFGFFPVSKHLGLSCWKVEHLAFLAGHNPKRVAAPALKKLVKFAVVFNAPGINDALEFHVVFTRARFSVHHDDLLTQHTMNFGGSAPKPLSKTAVRDQYYDIPVLYPQADDGRGAAGALEVHQETDGQVIRVEECRPAPEQIAVNVQGMVGVAYQFPAHDLILFC